MLPSARKPDLHGLGMSGLCEGERMAWLYEALQIMIADVHS